jgi:N-acetylneuraminic acid mutarotase
LLPSGKVLVTGGNGSTGSLSGAELYDSAINSWSAAGTLAAARSYHAATLLASGKVLVTGGSGSTGALSSAELYDPISDNWAPTGTLATERYVHTATLLPSGKVLVTGGIGSTGYLRSAELYDPGSNSWAAAGTLATARYGHTATLLPSGKVLVTGGYSGATHLNSAELYDPASNNWSAAGALATERSEHTSTLLPSGKVLVTGGYGNAGNLTNAELYDPASNSWSAAGSMATARYAHTATLLPSGKILVTGGYNSSTGILTSAERFDPASNNWSAAAALATERYAHTATLLPSGKVLVTGGVGGTGSLSSTELYDLGSDSWSTAGALATARNYQTATLLPTGKVLVTGGSAAGPLTSTDLYLNDLGFQSAWRPVVSTAPTSIPLQGKLTLAGSLFTGIGEDSGGNGSQNSASNYPLVQLQRLDNGQQIFIGADTASQWSASQLTTASLQNLTPGPAMLTVFVNGIPSLSRAISVTSPSTTAVTSSTPSVVAGQSLTFVATVTGNSPTGTVQFKDGVANLSGPVTVVQGAAQLSTTALITAGTHAITAVYSGDAFNAGSASSVLNQIVTQTTAQVGVSASPSNAQPGQPVTLTATVTGVSPGGTVQFRVNGINVGSPVAVINGVASLIITSLPAGSDSITAVYSGDANNVGTTSPPIIETITSVGDVPTLPEWGAILLATLLVGTMVMQSGGAKRVR